MDYVDNKIYKNGMLSMLLTEEGYAMLSGTTPTDYYYLKDHQVNNRVVINQSGTVQQVNHYYPFGGLFGEGVQTSNQPYRYNGKELDRLQGLDMYDYGARHYDATLGRWFTIDPLLEKYYSISPYVYVANNPVRFIDPDGMAWKPTYDEDPLGRKIFNGYEWVDEDVSYDENGNLLAGLYHQAIFFSDNGTFDVSSKYNIGSSTATVYKADGTTTTFDANTRPSNEDYATVPEGIYHATIGKYKGDYTALKMRDVNAASQTIALWQANPAHPERIYVTGINIHKPGLNNLTGLTNSGTAISQGCLLIDRNGWSDFINIFNTDAQRLSTVSVTVSRRMAVPVNVNGLPAFNFFMSGTRHSFFYPF